MEAKDRIIVALDTPDVGRAIDIVQLLNDDVGGFKIGPVFTSAVFAQMSCKTNTQGRRKQRLLLSNVQYLFELIGPRLFLDFKFHDIPETIAGGIAGLLPLSPEFISIQAPSGVDGIRAAVEKRGTTNILGITVLTSQTSDGCENIFGAKIDEKVESFAQMLVDGGAQGVVSSGLELPILSDRRFDSLMKVVPGIRPDWAQKHDQERAMTPKEALALGADRLVIGRPFLNASDPFEAVCMTIAEMESTN